jgi:transcriptional regulator with XRE-family HTH domain
MTIYFSQKIKQLREQTGMSQKDFGLFLFPGISKGGAQNKIKRFESATQEPLLSELLQISKVLKISPAVFLGEGTVVAGAPHKAVVPTEDTQQDNVKVDQKFQTDVNDIISDVFFIVRHGSIKEVDLLKTSVDHIKEGIESKKNQNVWESLDMRRIA